MYKLTTICIPRGMESFEQLHIKQNRKFCTRKEILEFEKNVEAALEVGL